MENSNAKWSRNLSASHQGDINRMRIIAKQKIESKRNRQQQLVVTSTRQASAKATLSGIIKSNDEQPDINDSFGGKNSNKEKFEEVTKEINESKKTNTIKNISSDINISSNLLASKDPYTESNPKISLSNEKQNLPNQSLSSNKNEEKLFEKNENLSKNCSTKINQSKSAIDLLQLSSTATSSIKKLSLSNSNLDDQDLNPLKTLLNSDELLNFATKIIPKNKTYQCTIIRDKKGIDRSLYPTYYMHLQAITNRGNESYKVEEKKEFKEVSFIQDIDDLKKNPSDYLTEQAILPENLNLSSSNRQVFLLSGRRRKKSKTYLIACDPFEITRSNCIAKLKSNVIGTQFNTIRITSSIKRLEYATIIYETNVLGFKGPRKMTVLLPKINSPINSPSKNSDFILLDLWKNDPSSVIQLKNKTPVWSEDTQSYVLNFHGRVTQASVKNFQLELCSSNEQDTLNISSFDNNDVQNKKNHLLEGQTKKNNLEVTLNNSLESINKLSFDNNMAMQFGRISNKEFTCDVTWPLSLLQAFSISLSSFDSKLACE